MDEKPQRTHDAPPEISPETKEQLAVSSQLRAEAEVKIVRAERSASEMAGMLRRLAEAIDRNPTSWDELFAKQRPEKS